MRIISFGFLTVGFALMICSPCFSRAQLSADVSAACPGPTNNAKNDLAGTNAVLFQTTTPIVKPLLDTNEVALAKKFLTNFFDKTFDPFENITWYEPKDRDIENVLWVGDAVYCYLGIRSNEPPFMRLVIRSAGSDWLFVKSLLVKTGEKLVRIENTQSQTKQGHSGASLWDTVDLEANQKLDLIKSIINSTNSMIRCQGFDSSRDVVVTKQQRESLGVVLLVYEYFQMTNPGFSATRRERAESN